MHSQLAENANETSKTFAANLTPRARELLTLEQYVEGTQYRGLADWFDDSKPLWVRAPCIVYSIAATAIRSNVDLVLGEGRFPGITSNPGEDDSAAEGLDEEQSKRVDRAIAELQKRTRFRAVMRQAFEHAQGEKSVALLFGARKGVPFAEVIRARWCTPAFDLEGCVTKLEIRYPYIQWEKQPDGRWRTVVMLYRRVIDATSDLTYRPVVAKSDGKEPDDGAWVVDKERSVQAHGLGFCPVVWYAHMRECATVADFDGTAIHERYLDEMRGLDYALSMRHRAVLFGGNPQVIETGVERGYNPSGAVGDAISMPSTLSGGDPSASNPVTGEYSSAQARPGRIMSPGVAWQYENKDAKVSYLTLPPEAVKALDEHIADLRNKIAEGFSVVILDPENVKFAAAMSGKAIESLRSRQFDRCDQYRDDAEAGLLLPSILMLLRVAMKTGTSQRIPALKPVESILAKFAANDTAAPMLTVRWPSGYTKADPEDEQMVVLAATTALEKGAITKRMALEKLAPIYGVTNVDQALEQVEQEAQERQQQALDQVAAQSAAKQSSKGDDEKMPTDKAA